MNFGHPLMMAQIRSMVLLLFFFFVNEPKMVALLGLLEFFVEL